MAPSLHTDILDLHSTCMCIDFDVLGEMTRIHQSVYVYNTKHSYKSYKNTVHKKNSLTLPLILKYKHVVRLPYEITLYFYCYLFIF